MRFCYIEVPFHMFYYYWGEENRLLHWGLHYIEVRYIEILRFHCISFNYFWKFLSLGNSAWDFLGVNWSRDVLGFGSLPPFNHPRHLKSVVPPPPNWVWLPIGCVAWEICFNQSRSTTQIWVVMRYQYGISVLFSQTSICGENQWWRRLISAVSQATAMHKVRHLAPVVQKADCAILRINLYPVDSAIGFPNTYPLVIYPVDSVTHLLNNCMGPGL